MEPLQNLMKSIGLTGFDVKVYLTLLSLGETTIAKLEEELEAHRAQVHSSLRRLFSKGLVEVYSGKPTTYRAVPPEVLLDVVRRELEDDFQDAELFLKNLPRKQPSSTRGVWVYKSSKGLLSRFTEAIERAERNVVVCGDVDFTRALKEKILEKASQGVIVYVLIYEIPGSLYREDVAEGLRKVKRAVSGDLLVLADSKVGVIAQRRFNAGKLPSYGLVVEEPVLIDYLEENFINRWMHSKPIVDEEVSPPFCMTVFKLAVLEVERLLREGHMLSVVCRGRWKTGERGSLEGEVERAVFDVTSGLVQLHVKDSSGKVFTAGASDAIVEDFACEEVCVRGIGGAQ